jgi:GDP-4-dehydro-6-deoxy-D-mannose reductase
MRTLVTGSCGFVGRYLVNDLISEGYQVLGIDMHAVGFSEGNDKNRRQPVDEQGHEKRGKLVSLTDDNYRENELGGEINIPMVEELQGVPLWPRGAQYRRCDILDTEKLDRIVSWWRPQIVFHLAAQSSAAKSFKDPVGTLQTNVIGSLNLFEAVRKFSETEESGSRIKVISIGSCEEYGKRQSSETPITEESPVEPLSPYASSKASQSLLALQYHRAHQLDITVTRSFSHTGPGQMDTFALPNFAKQCAEIKLKLRKPVIRVGNLSVIRDFLDVRDVVRAYRLLAEEGGIGEIYNVCSGEGLHLKKALEKLIDIISIDVKVEQDPDRMRPADVPVLLGDNRKLTRETSWKRTIYNDRMLEDLVNYWGKRVELSVGGE